MSGEASRHKTGVHVLPDNELAYIFSFLRPSLHVMLVCQNWCRVTVEACPAWWRSVHVSGRPYKRVEGSMAQEIQELDDDDHDDQSSGREAVSFSQPAVLAGFKRVALHFHELQITHASDIILPLAPELLGLAASRSPHLESLTLAGGLADEQACRAALEAIGAMTELKCLELEPRLNRGGLVSASYLAPLSALTQLRSLDLQLFMCCGPLPATILPRLQHLTHLGLFLSASPSSPEGVVGWGAGAAGSPRLRSLILYDARLPPEEATVASLGQLEVLRVLGLCPTPRHLSTLVRSLTALTYLRLGDAYPADSAEEVREPGLNKLDLDWSMQLVSGCRQLARLELLEHAELVSLQLPRGALRQLTYLALEYEDVEDVEELEVHASWASLPSLACLRLTVELRLPNATLAGLRELDVGATLYDLGDNEDPLHCPDLTHLVVSDISLVNRRRGLPPQHMLQQLRRLTVQHYGHGWLRDSGLMGVPSSLAQATSLEVLDMRGCRELQLRKADAELLSQACTP